MSRALLLGTLLFAGPFLSMSCVQDSWAQNSSAQNKTEPTQAGPPSRLQRRHFGGTIPARPESLARSFVREENRATS